MVAASAFIHSWVVRKIRVTEFRYIFNTHATEDFQVCVCVRHQGYGIGDFGNLIFVQHDVPFERKQKR